MYSIDFAEHIWACSMEADWCWTPVLAAVSEYSEHELVALANPEYSPTLEGPVVDRLDRWEAWVEDTDPWFGCNDYN